ncbi:hypothetical protein RND81_11G044700 [Saponaria officinalis]|uniref:S-acyltransferase n=1 Tax=Saponaria officinalis TaxID=3572 RepID=A0AAW1HJH8_SAPOF
MRKHGWQLPYHPLQVVAVAVFLALGFAFYVFFGPFVGKNKLFQYIIMGVYTPLIFGAFSLYIWCAAADPADPGVFRSKKYLKTSSKLDHTKAKNPNLGGKPISSNQNVKGDKSLDGDGDGKSTDVNTEEFDAQHEHQSSANCSSWLWGILCFPCTFLCNCISPSEESSERHTSEDGMFYCSLCEVEVFKYSKHCRVCDKCVDHFDHHCRWLNNCIGKRNYRQFFTLMVVSILLLILQWSTGIFVLVCSFIERKRFNVEIISKLGSSFSMVPFVIVVAVCTLLAMIATLPLAQLFFFHILLIKKGLSTYDYIVALREQEQQEVGGGQSPQMSQVSSLTGMSSASSFNAFRRGAWCTPPRLFLEDQFDVVPPDTGSVSSYGKKTSVDEPIKKKNPAVKISPWTLARLNAEDVSKAAAEAKKRSKILQPVIKRDGTLNLDRDNSFRSSGGRMIPRPDYSRRRPSKRVRLPTDLAHEQLVNIPSKASKASSSLAPLQLEARSAFRTSLAMSSVGNMAGSSPESSVESADGHPFRLSSSGAEESRRLTGLSVSDGAALPEMPLSRSTSDGYEASGGEDSDQVPSRPVERPVNWSNLLFGANSDEGFRSLKVSSSSTFSQGSNLRKF